MIRALQRSMLTLLLRIFPVFRRAVVVGWPDTEGNSVEVLRYLIAHYSGEIYWLVSKPPEELTWQISDVPGYHRVRYRRKNEWRALAAYLTAEMVFFTHGLYASPAPGRRRLFVNLWHGDGPKKTENKAFSPKVRSTIVVGGTRLWGNYKAAHFGLNQTDAAIVGNPRIDQFDRPASDSDLIRLDLDPSRKLIIWLPTYREVKSTLYKSWSDGTKLSAQSIILNTLTTLVSDANSRNMQVIFKPHPMEADFYLGAGVKVISEAALLAARVPFYSLLARTSALITDYSSVWTDYFPLNRPIAFFCPDLQSYEAARGFNVENLAALLPGNLLQTAEDFRKFVGEVANESDSQRSLREKSVSAIGAVCKTGATGRLFGVLIAKGAISNMK